MVLYHKIIGKGRPLFILHGLFGSLDNWNTLGKRFAEDRMVILVDQRNHGRSFHHQDMTYSTMADDLVQLMDHLEIQKADILGHSMGGKTVMMLALNHPDRLDRLIVADIGPKDYPSHHDKILEGLFSVDIENIKSRSEAIGIIQQHIDNEGVVQFLTKNLYWKGKGVLAWRMNLDVIAENIDEILASVGDRSYNGETLFIRGGLSDYIDESELMAIHMQFTDSQVLTIENVGHWLHAEDPESFYTIVHSFLSSSAL